MAPKEYFEVGDIYYNEDFEPVGVVCWVNNANIKEAKIINLDGVKSTWYCGSGNGLGMDFSTPNFTDGEGNTRDMVDFNKTLATPYIASNSAFMWAATYAYEGVSGWYLPAIDEWVDVAANLTKINETLVSLGKAKIEDPKTSSVHSPAAPKPVQEPLRRHYRQPLQRQFGGCAG